MNTDKIRELNDNFRANFIHNNTLGIVVYSQYVNLLPFRVQSHILAAVIRFNDFNEGNDTYGEHDFGKVSYNGQDYFFKIDYYDNDLKYHSPNPADPTCTKRVLTVMHVSEY